VSRERRDGSHDVNSDPYSNRPFNHLEGENGHGGTDQGKGRGRTKDGTTSTRCGVVGGGGSSIGRYSCRTVAAIASVSSCGLEYLAYPYLPVERVVEAVECPDEVTQEESLPPIVSYNYQGSSERRRIWVRPKATHSTTPSLNITRVVGDLDHDLSSSREVWSPFEGVAIDCEVFMTDRRKEGVKVKQARPVSAP
jgi:hypothetical protein